MRCRAGPIEPERQPSPDRNDALYCASCSGPIDTESWLRWPPTHRSVEPVRRTTKTSPKGCPGSGPRLNTKPDNLCVGPDDPAAPRRPESTEGKWMEAVTESPQSEDTPDVSVILAVYNTMPYLTECLQSLIRQTIGHARMEIIAVNDGSTDESPAELERFAA